jgi:transcriptional regulator
VKDKKTDLLQGTLDLLILRTLSQGPKHGFGVAKCIEDTSHGALQVGEGSLYPALHRLEHKGLIESEWGRTEGNRRARFYSITESGEAQLESEEQQWRRYAVAVELILQLA